MEKSLKLSTLYENKREGGKQPKGGGGGGGEGQRDFQGLNVE